MSPAPPALAGRFFATEPPGQPVLWLGDHGLTQVHQAALVSPSSDQFQPLLTEVEVVATNEVDN